MVVLLCKFFLIEAQPFDCYSNNGNPVSCSPQFENAAFGKQVEATNTCGSPAEDYCVTPARFRQNRSCHICDAQNPNFNHDANFMTDADPLSWWQSSSLYGETEHPRVNLTIHLGKYCFISSFYWYFSML